MTATPASPAASQQATVDAALLILERMGLSPDDLTAAPRQRPAVPTFAEYVPVVSATVSDGTRKAYGPYWNRVVEQWGPRSPEAPSPSEIAPPAVHPTGRRRYPAGGDQPGRRHHRQSPRSTPLYVRRSPAAAYEPTAGTQ
jgi:hypothetical protein